MTRQHEWHQQPSHCRGPRLNHPSSLPWPPPLTSPAPITHLGADARDDVGAVSQEVHRPRQHGGGRLVARDEQRLV